MRYFATDLYIIYCVSRWSKHTALTDELLTLIEGNTKWKVAFGFDKASAMDGKTIIECCAQIAKALFIDKSDSKWAAAYRKVVVCTGSSL